MKIFNNRLKVTELLKDINGSLDLAKDVILDNASELIGANESSLCFYERVNYLKDLRDLKAGLLIVPHNFDKNLLPHTNLLFTEKPYLTFNSLIYKWLQLEKFSSPSKSKGNVNASESCKIHPTVVTGSDSLISKDVDIKENVVIGKNTKIGSGTVIESNSVIGNDVEIGCNCHIFPNTTIYADTIIRNNVIIHAGCTIGTDGFGYILSENKQQKIYHVGKVIIEDDVEIGSNTCIDRGTLGETIIGKGTKIDNLVQIAHNCRIGRHSVLCAQVGLSGNTVIGDYVYLAGQVGVAGHLKIGDGAMVGAQSGISGDVPAGEKYWGTPAVQANLQKRIVVSTKRLPEMLKFINRLKKQRD